MLGWIENIEKLTLENEDFRRVLFTGKNSQVVLMCVEVGDEVGWEVHPDNDQFFRLEQGQLRLDLGVGEEAVDESHNATDAWAMVVPAGTWHNLVNTGSEAVKLYTIYSPPHHPVGTIHKTKADADAAEEAEAAEAAK
jgi:mannose-6-phosphate isomerase-like protein (cupin superfamily)